MIKNKIIINTLKKKFNKDGYVIIKNFFKKEECLNASRWLKKQDPKKIRTSWTEQEPNVPLAVYFAIHNYETPL